MMNTSAARNVPFAQTVAVSRRDAIHCGLAAIGVAAAGAGLSGPAGAAASETSRTPDDRKRAVKRYDMKKSINLWAFPYPDRMTLQECMQLAKDAGFEG